MDPLRELIPDHGAYPNEADRYEPNWEASFYGLKNFKRLKEIKKKYDPHNLF